MALTDENGGGIGATMLVGPTGVGGNYNGYPMAYPVMPMMSGMGGGMGNSLGNDWGALLILFLFAAMFGGFGGNGGRGGFGGGLGYDFPWLLNGQNGINNNVSDGFRDAQLHDSVTSVRDGVSNLATQLCGCCGDMQMTMSNGFANTTAAITGAQNALAQQMYANQIADLNRFFDAQTANTQAMKALQSQFAQCCCDNRLATNDLKFTIAQENCADRATISEGIRDLLTAQTAGTQRILDQLCQDKIDQKNDTIAQLRSELIYARGQASQDVQTARILAGQTAEVDALYNRLASCPVGTMPVYGNQPIFTCPNNNNGCGCGCGM